MCFRPSHSSFKGSNVEAQISSSQGALLVPWLFCCRSLGFQLGIRSVFTVKWCSIPAILPSELPMRESLCSQTRVGSTRNGKRKISIPPKKSPICEHYVEFWSVLPVLLNSPPQGVIKGDASNFRNSSCCLFRSSFPLAVQPSFRNVDGSLFSGARYGIK